jgi:hypothetical protein
MRELKRNRKNESDSRYFNGYTDDTVPDVPYGTGGVPQYNPMIVNDRIELMDDVIKKLGNYWYSEDPKLEDEVTRTTNREEVLYIKDIYWELDNPDVVTVKFGLAAFDGSNDRVAETREIDINFENFLGRDIEGDLVIFISKKIKSLLDSVLHGGLYKENKTMRELKRSREMVLENENMELIRVKKALDTLYSVRRMAGDIEKGLYGIKNSIVDRAVMDLNGSIYRLVEALQDLEAIYRRENH